MPLYDYRCVNTKCVQTQFPVRMSITQVSSRVVKCPVCKQVAERVYTAPVVRGPTPKFHGGGG